MAQLDTHRTRRNGHDLRALRSRADDVMSDFADLRRDVSRLTDAASKAARSEMSTAGDRLSRARTQLTTRARNGAAYVGDQVREHPAATVGITLGAGMLIGMLLSRGRNR